MRAYMPNAVDVLIEECKNPAITQRSVALTYAFAMRNEAELGEKQPWGDMNRAILARWPKGLERVKTMAWNIRRGKQKASK